MQQHHIQQYNLQLPPPTQDLSHLPSFLPVEGPVSPFTAGATYGKSFRIPALATLSDGSLIAAADARWNTSYDGGGLDTLTARSTDGGKSWKQQLTNYLGDNGNQHNLKSTSFIDPALATDGKTIYLLTDLYPWGIALNGAQEQPQRVSGFNAEGKLLLTRPTTYGYGYYLDGNLIKLADGTVVPGYTVDSHFFITNTTDQTKTNLFFEDSPFQVQRTSYLYLRISKDGGSTWSDPKLLPFKKNTEMAYLVGPGRGLITKSGRIIFPCYTFDGSANTQRTDFIYSDDRGATWKRSNPMPGPLVSSESAVVELNDGTLRFFFRNQMKRLYYADYTQGQWKTPVNTDIPINSDCQISAITYSKTVQGKELLFVSCSTGPSPDGIASSNPQNRVNGKIFVGTVGADNTMTWLTDSHITVNQGGASFLYSCLTELSDGSIGLLYEDGAASGAGSIGFKVWQVNP